MLPPRLNPTFLTSGFGFLPRSHSCIPTLLNHKAGSAIARGRFSSCRNGNGIGNVLGRDVHVRNASSSSSSTRWKSRQGKDSWAREAKVKGLKSRAAFKLLEIDTKYKIFKRGQTVVDLGYAPGSWSQVRLHIPPASFSTYLHIYKSTYMSTYLPTHLSMHPTHPPLHQVAYSRTQPHGRILGIDIIPAQPPQGVSTIQGNFLSRRVQQSVKNFLLDPDRGRPRRPLFSSSDDVENDEHTDHLDIAASEPSYIDLERHMDDNDAGEISSTSAAPEPSQEPAKDTTKMVHVVLSDMCAPWEQTTGFWKRSLSDPYNRMMNTTGIKFSDHAGSMDLCNAALQFAFDTLRPGGHFVCKFYQGAEDKELELKLKKMFAVVHREKPESSRSESKEAYFVALRRNGYNDAASLGYVNDV
ncbi:putative 21s rrna (uridine -2 -o)-methyltransferase mrm2 protein [Botrytis fragariae]|uniref:rRNA methyltransferase 2, mitochondrial n=1 Tax=Botrytis fragariae TaxID=1964551 RepID=A0A8H6ALB0_9HELO|nr:putative 21s rrna (uridine -2 -o)-methyltransferase mrm2 protein [Botrytis fragariae]KAF5869436.1 putative 21s rrna (uridine -2 -o)-methyltransferase mrm2 protein [Botrytis fragariae]